MFILPCRFESLLARLATSTWSDWMNVLLLSIPYHTQKTNFIIQLIHEIKLNHYLPSLWACSGMLDHTHLKPPTNICCFHRLLFTSKNSTSYLNLFVRYWGFWTITQELDFFRTSCLCKKLKDHWHFHNEIKKHVWIYHTFPKTLKPSFSSHFGDFLSPLSPSKLFQKPRSIIFCASWCLTSWKKSEKTDDL